MPTAVKDVDRRQYKQQVYVSMSHSIKTVSQRVEPTRSYSLRGGIPLVNTCSEI